MSFHLIDIKDANELQRAAILDITRQFELTTKKIHDIKQHFINEMHKGLEKHGNSLAMIPSYVPGTPTGKEIGTFLALDLGGTNLRVCQITFLGGSEIKIKQQKYKVLESLKTGEARALFDFIAESIDRFLTDLGDEHNDGKLDLGFTFSFPVEQTAINKGTLLHWTKGFAATGAVGKDVVELLQDSLNRKNVPVRVAALVNDTVGTLLAYTYIIPNALMGVILGTGTNGAYVEKVKAIKKLGNFHFNSEDMIVNMEWGGFDNERKVLPITLFDNKLDRESINPRAQIFEKLISGMYLGEIARNVIIHLIDSDLLFKEIHFQFSNITYQRINQQWGFETAYLSRIEADLTPNLDNTNSILKNDLNVYESSLTDRQIIKRICQLIGIRAARLAATGLAAVITHRKAVESGCSIGIDGTLFEFYPHFEQRIRGTFDELIGSNADKIALGLARDGSGVGAAIAAMMAAKNRE
ncbi:hypothetical protein G9A89_021762 [Geosiphon pyriformis]|nr:hypothetical protein G9A89_021762 [Geosiphon pyriformis]